jgi:hypothetical protein
MANESFVVAGDGAQPQALVETPRRDGETYDHGRDGRRLAAQHQAIFDLMRDGCWRSLGAIEIRTGHAQASISARLRDFRKPQFGAHGVNRRHIANGLFEYRLVLNKKDLFE